MIDIVSSCSKNGRVTSTHTNHQEVETLDSRRARVLLIDDDDDSEVITRGLLSAVRGATIDLKWVGSFEQGLDAIRRREFDAYLVDYRLGARDGIELIRIAVSEGCRAPLILMTGQGEHAVDVQAMQEGAADFLIKGRIQGTDIERSIRHAIERFLEAEERLKYIAELEILSSQLPVILWTTDEQLTFTSHRGAGLLRLDQKPGQVVGQKVFEYFQTEGNHPPLIEPHQRALQGEPVTYEWRWMKRKYRVQVNPLHNGQHIIGTVGIALDITDVQQLEEEVSAARLIQEGLLPRKSPSIPGFDVAGRCRPTSATGGDYFDFIEIFDGTWGIVVADVSGHGFASALVTMETRRLIRTLVDWSTDLGEILSSANRAVCEHPEASRKFVTLFFACLDHLSQSFTYSAAGHPAYLLDGQGRSKTLGTNGLPLGIMANEKYPNCGPISLAPGDVLLLYTDGISETFNPEGEKFGDQRVIDIVQAHRQLKATEIVDVVFQEVLKFCHPAEPHDDLTFVVVKVDSASHV